MAKLSFLLGQETSRGELSDTKVGLVDGQVYFAYDADAEDARIYFDTSLNGTTKRIGVNSNFSDYASVLWNTSTGAGYSAGGTGRPVYFYNGIPQAITTAISVSYGGTGTATAPVKGGVIYGASTSAYGSTAAGTSGQLLQSAGTGKPTWITATDSNTVSTIVKRDANGNFSAGTISADLNGLASKATADSNNYEFLRFYDSALLNGTAIPANADLNTLDYIKVGNYHCNSANTAKTLTNCPTTQAFKMQVLTFVNPSVDDEDTRKVYRIRKILTHQGHTYIQYVNSESAIGSFTYQGWRLKPRLTVNSMTTGAVIYASNDKEIGYTTAGTSGQLLQSTGGKTPTWITATNAATASTIVKRDASGNFSAGTITAALSGNATTATALETPRTILVNLAATTAASFDGSADITPGVKGTLPVIQGGTGLASLTSGSALIGNGKNAVTLRAITNNTSATAVTANTNLITANTLYYHKGNSNLVTVGTITSGTWNGSTVAIAYGGTGGTSAATARSNLHYSAATITAIDDDTTTNWGAKGPLSLDWYSTAGQITDQPSTYGFALNFSKKNNASEVHQLWITQPGGDLLHRGGNSSGWSGTWKTLLDSSNFATHLDGTYVNVSGDTMTGKLTVPTITLSSTSGVKHIEFTRGSHNYITAPTGGTMLFCADGADLSLSACTMGIAGTYVRFNQAPLIYSSTAIADNVPARLNFQVHQSDNDVTATGFIACYDDSDNVGYGTNMVIVPGSNLVMGGGESALTVYNNSLTSNYGEATYLTSDKYIYFVSNCGTNSGADAKTLAIDGNGYFYPATDGTGAIGINTNRWSYLMGRTIVGTSGYTYGTTLPKGNYVGRLFLLPA